MWKKITILIGCPLEWPAQMFCLGKKICNRFWWLKMSLHLSTSNILIYSVRSMSLLVREFVINHSKSIDKKEHEKKSVRSDYRPFTYSNEVMKHLRLAKICADSWYFGKHEMPICVFVSISLLSINKAWIFRNEKKRKK